MILRVPAVLTCWACTRPLRAALLNGSPTLARWRRGTAAAMACVALWVAARTWRLGLAEHTVLAALQALPPQASLCDVLDWRLLEARQCLVAPLMPAFHAASAHQEDRAAVGGSDQRIYAQVYADDGLLWAGGFGYLADEAHRAIGEAHLHPSGGPGRETVSGRRMRQACHSCRVATPVARPELRRPDSCKPHRDSGADAMDSALLVWPFMRRWRHESTASQKLADELLCALSGQAEITPLAQRCQRATCWAKRKARRRMR